MHPITITCTKCDFSDSETKTWGAWSYQSGNLKVSVSRRLSVCYDCNAVTSMEVLPDQNSVDQLKALAEQNPAQPHRKKMLEEELLRKELFRDRTSPPRCLHCLGMDVVAIPVTEPDADYERAGNHWKTGLTHRNCGGRLYGRNSEASYFFGDKLKDRVIMVEDVL